MKFKRGFWLMGEHISPLYAVQPYRLTLSEHDARILIATQPVNDRGATLSAALNMRLFSPAEGVIGVEAWHFSGAKENFPRYELNADETIGHVTREGNELVLTSGRASARLNLGQGSWSLRLRSRRSRRRRALVLAKSVPKPLRRSKSQSRRSNWQKRRTK